MNGSEGVVGLLVDLTHITLIQIGLIVLGAWLLVALSQRLVPWIADHLPGHYRLHVLALIPVLRLAVIVLALVLVVPRVVEPTFENLVALLGALGLAIGFALRDYVSSLIAGVVTLYEMPYRPGDWIEIEGVYGEVRSIGLRAVELVTRDDTVVIVPHLKLWDHLLHNANDGTRDLLCVARFYLDPHHDPILVHRLLYDVALTSPYLQLDHHIRISMSDEPWGSHYRIKAYPVDPRQQFQFITDLTVRAKGALLAAGVTFAASAAIPREPT
jgi:small-conductance mechanosensitive channel